MKNAYKYILGSVAIFGGSIIAAVILSFLAGGLLTAVKNLTNAGYEARDLEAYVIMGLPEQEFDEVISSIFFVNNLGVQIKLASYSPIPGTKDFERAVANGMLSPDIDPLLTNNSIFPLRKSDKEYETYKRIRSFAQMLNSAAKQQFTPIKEDQIGSALASILRGGVELSRQT